MRVFINPIYDGEDQADGGVRRVVDAQARGLEELGWSIARSAEGADLIVNHGALLAESPGIPMVSCCHGLYWDEYDWGPWAKDVNQRVINALIRADAVTAPSRWVSRAITRGVCQSPAVIYHGVNPEDWAPEPSKRFVLWNKARVDPVSSPKDLQELVKRLPNVPFVSTFGESTKNLTVTGSMTYPEMRKILPSAGVYLTTARETFGIGTLEAMACGVPIVGWRYGGQEEIVIEGETGMLVPYGDYDALAEATEWCLTHRDRLGAAARADVSRRWRWDDKIQQYANVFEDTVRRFRAPSVRVSIVVTCYNLAKYLPECLRSISSQSLRDWECIVVDDASTDTTPAVVKAFSDVITQSYRCPENLGLSGARNAGAKLARGEFLLFLDADDMLEPSALERLVDGLRGDPSMHVGFGGLVVVDEDGKNPRQNPWPGNTVDWSAQMAHLNQLPYSALWRREAFLRTGGYRERDWRAEDASLWCRALSFGIRAKRVTSHPTLIYRLRENSKSQEESRAFQDRDGDWTAWYPWRVGASSGPEGSDLVTAGKTPPRRKTPFGAPVPGPIHHHQDPAVSVIIPVGAGHERFLVDALDSLIAQTVPDWEVLVIKDTLAPLPLRGHGHARVIRPEQPSLGPAGARNLGVSLARAPLCLFLDADDYLEPQALEKMLRLYAEDGGYIYSDCYLSEDRRRPDVNRQVFASGDYNRQVFLSSGYGEGQPGQHGVTILVAKADLLAIKGFDEGLPFWEDWELMLQLADLGLCGRRIAEPLYTYRLHTGLRRRSEDGRVADVQHTLRDRFLARSQEVDAMCGCGGGGPRTAQRAQSALQGILEPQDSPPVLSTDGSTTQFREGDLVTLQYIGTSFGAIPVRGQITRRTYRMGLDPVYRAILADPRDVPGLLLTGDLQIVRT